MPRTKRTSESLNKLDLFIKDFQKKVQLRLVKLENDAEININSYETCHNTKLASLHKELKQMTLGEILKWKEDEKENYNEVSSSVNDQTLFSVPKTVKAKNTSKRATAASDDGYVTEGTVTGAHTARTSRISRTSKAKNATTEAKTRRVTRSSSKNNISTMAEMTLKKSKENSNQLKIDKLKTPATLKSCKSTFDVITPKIKPNTSINVLRRPREGEMVVSMQGSPLLVSAIVPDNTANINVPLSNGNVMSLLPKDGLRMSHIPPLDSETMRQLQTLKDHIEKVILFK